MAGRGGRYGWVLGALGIAFMVLSGCGAGTEAEGPDRGELRVPVGKADDTMSCKDVCGEQAPGGCWCDDACATYGDCCTDKVAQCDPQAQPSCEGACGKKSKDGCWCDSACAKYGDCCPDKKQVCDGPSGCTSNSDCKASEYCHLDTGCLDGKAKGECKTRPTICPKGGKGVCACDGKTYLNSCEARAKGNNVKDPDNKCIADIQCGGIAGIPCPKGFKCWLNGGHPDASGKCVPENQCNTAEDCKGLTPLVKCWGDWQCVKHSCSYKCGHSNPVCYVGGCNSEICSPDKDAASACVALPWHSCLKLTQCGNFTAEGDCSWKPTTAYIDCMAKFGKVVCDYDSDPNTTYLVKDANKCKVVKFSCAPGAKPFFDACGCGCKQ